MKIYVDAGSLAASRVSLAVSLMRLRPMWIPIDRDSGVLTSQAFLGINPFGKLPMLDDCGHVVWESSAIVVYLAARYRGNEDWIPRDAQKLAQMQEWLLVSHDLQGPNVIIAAGRTRRTMDMLARAMCARLSTSAFLVGTTSSVADICVYSAIREADPTMLLGPELGPIARWMRRIEALPGFTWDSPCNIAVQAHSGLQVQGVAMGASGDSPLLLKPGFKPCETLSKPGHRPISASV